MPRIDDVLERSSAQRFLRHRYTTAGASRSRSGCYALYKTCPHDRSATQLINPPGERRFVNGIVWAATAAAMRPIRPRHGVAGFLGVNSSAPRARQFHRPLETGRFVGMASVFWMSRRAGAATLRREQAQIKFLGRGGDDRSVANEDGASGATARIITSEGVAFLSARS